MFLVTYFDDVHAGEWFHQVWYSGDDVEYFPGEFGGTNFPLTTGHHCYFLGLRQRGGNLGSNLTAHRNIFYKHVPEVVQIKNVTLLSYIKYLYNSYNMVLFSLVRRLIKCYRYMVKFKILHIIAYYDGWRRGGWVHLFLWLCFF